MFDSQKCDCRFLPPYIVGNPLAIESCLGVYFGFCTRAPFAHPQEQARAMVAMVSSHHTEFGGYVCPFLFMMDANALIGSQPTQCIGHLAFETENFAGAQFHKF